MGLQNVGIHARSADDKLRQDQKAHVLDDETKRKFIHSVKRLITFSQRKYPSKDSTWK